MRTRSWTSILSCPSFFISILNHNKAEMLPPGGQILERALLLEMLFLLSTDYSSLSHSHWKQTTSVTLIKAIKS